ncbi:MAG: histidine phosphatase family protein, partial [Acidobacteriaceae bacterium]|nr:histidine phosphatase family protein [Acidobacteriaceae bacterium]
MIRILLIRHGATELTGRVLYGRMPGVHINAEGCRQVQALSQALKERYEVDEIISSPLERALETAQYLADALRLPIETDDDVVELDYGNWMGLTFAEIRESDEWQHYNRLRSISSPPKGEFMMQVQARAWTALEKILSRHAQRETATVAMVSHGDVIRALLILLLGMPL